MNKVKKLWKIVSRPALGMTLLKYRVAAGVEHENTLRKFAWRTIVDVGANRGQYALIARHCLPEAKIISFEPLPIPAALYRKEFEGDGNTVLFEAALGRESGIAKIHVAGRDDSSSLLPITQRQDTLFPGTGEERTEEIRVGPLREFVREEQIGGPALLKLDVQGFELEALKGSEEFLHRFKNVYVECSFLELYQGQALASDVIAYLFQQGFVLEGIYNTAYDSKGLAVQADFLFGRKVCEEK